MKNFKFKPASFLLLRIPSWSINKFDLFSNSDSEYIFEIYSQNEDLREAISIASPSLSNSLNKKTRNKQEIKSLSNYISRMMNRATPFGMFSFISMASWGQNTTIKCDGGLLSKKALFDIEWTYEVIKKIYQCDTNLLSLPIRTNPLVQLCGDRFQVDYLRGMNEVQSKIISIRASFLINFILKQTIKCVTVNQIILQLQKEIPNLQQDKTLAVVRQLLSQQFLLPGILPSLLNPSPIDSLLPYVSLVPGLKSLCNEIDEYNELPIGQGEKKLNSLQEKMAEIVETPTYLQVNTIYKEKEFRLSENVLFELSNSLHFLFDISSFQHSAINLASYHANFIEKYGEFRIVPLLELLNDEKGLGSLFESPSPPLQNTPWTNWLHEQWQDCLISKKKELVLTEKMIEPFLNQKNDNKMVPLSFDVICNIISDSNEEIDAGKFLILIKMITKEGGNVFGRFLDILGEKAKKEIANFFAEEEKLEPESLFVELSYLPTKIHTGNVAINPLLRSYHLDIESNEKKEGSIALEDIYVGASTSNFYLTDRECKYNIITRSNNLCSSYYAPPPLKFMRYVTFSQHPSISLFEWGNFKDTASFLPRVRLGKTVLSPAQWNINPNAYLGVSTERSIFLFQQWADKWELPERFNVIHADQHLLMNRKNPKHIAELARKLKNGVKLTLAENLDKAWVNGKNGKHSCEICVPFVRSSVNNSQNRKSVPFNKNADYVRDKLPGSEWIYFKLFLNDNRMNDFLVGYLFNYIEIWREKGIIQEWFIVRYSNPKSHLRLRLLLSSNIYLSDVLINFEEKFKTWTQENWLSDIFISKYEREIERYGGVEMIQHAETFFFYDTLSIGIILRSLLMKNILTEPIIIFSLSIINFLRNWGFNEHQMLSFLNEFSIDEAELKGFRTHKSQLVNLLKALSLNNIDIPEIKMMQNMSKIAFEGINLFSQYAKNILEQNQINSIIKSFLHMHCNRLGCTGKTEMQAKLYARKAISVILNDKSNSSMQEIKLQFSN
ncbi:MAG: lantibiotic dehydratase [Parachlamydia sp.]|nr:lantibiotic dehydratase [Parachlamydia sp.]